MNFSRDRFFLFGPGEEHDESSRMPACTWVRALSFGRCRMSKFWLLVYLDFFESLRRALLCAMCARGESERCEGCRRRWRPSYTGRRGLCGLDTMRHQG